MVPHKALKSTDRKIGDDLDHLIDLSAQIVVLDRQAKIHKQVREYNVFNILNAHCDSRLDFPHSGCLMRIYVSESYLSCLLPIFHVIDRTSRNAKLFCELVLR